MKDQDLERIIRQLAKDTSANDSDIDEIADSPALWWAVQRGIRQAETVRAPWPPSVLCRFLLIAVPAAAALVVGAVFLLSRTPAPDVAATQETSASSAEPAATETSPLPATPTGQAGTSMTRKEPRSVAPLRAAASVKRSAVSLRPMTARNRVQNVTPAAEIKSDFIALAYARSPESGQLVRVKVPSSMMVQLGVVPTVAKPTELIDAEALVGDDGLTHAIRFIHQ